MDTEKYRALLSAIDHGSLSAAADQLGYTISGISRSVASLENQLGFSLLVRSKSGVVPTADCEKLLPNIREILRHQELLQQTADRIRGLETGSVSVGIAYPPFHSRLSSLIVSFRNKYPGISVQLTEGTSSELSGLMEEKKLDLCIISQRDNVPEFQPLFHDHLCIWVPVDHPAVKNGVYPVRYLEQDDYILIHPGKETDNSLFLKELHLSPKICASTSDVDAVYAMVNAGLGVSLMNHIFDEGRKGSVISLPLDHGKEFDIGLAAPHQEDRSPAAQEFFSFLETAFSDQNVL